MSLVWLATYGRDEYPFPPDEGVGLFNCPEHGPR